MRDKIQTSAEVFAVIKARHGDDLMVFSSFTNPYGTQFGGDGTVGEIETSYGFKNADYPIMGEKRTWDIHHVEPLERLNERNEYWLYVNSF